MKDQHLETQTLNDISTIAGAFAVASSVWNQKRGSSRCVFRILEKAGSFDDGSGDISPRGSENGDGEKQDQAVLTIKQGLVDHTLVVDPEINLAATLIRLSRL